LDYDETRLRRVSSDVRGRIERLRVAYAGSPVRQDDPLYDIFSPELISAQEELLQALKTPGNVEGSGERRTVATESLAEASRQRLRWWGVTQAQIAEIERTGEISNASPSIAPLAERSFTDLRMKATM